jgi:4-carboxymuconolactone decarboxylase
MMASRARVAAMVAISLLSSYASVMAQDRLPPLSAEALTPAQKKAAEEFAAARGAAPFGPFAAMLRSPEMMNRARAMGDYLRYRSVLPPRLSEFLILLTARHWSQRYEWNAHYEPALKAGLAPEVIKAISDGRRPDKMADDEEILWEFSSELQRNQSVSDATYARVVKAFGEQGVIDATGIMGYYTLLGMTLNVARTPVPPDAPRLEPFPR